MPHTEYACLGAALCTPDLVLGMCSAQLLMMCCAVCFDPMQCALAVPRLLQAATLIVATALWPAQCATAHAVLAEGQSQPRVRQAATGQCRAHAPSSKQVGILSSGVLLARYMTLRVKNHVARGDVAGWWVLRHAGGCHRLS